MIFFLNKSKKSLDFALCLSKVEGVLEQFTNEVSQLLCKDLPANPCHDNSAGKRNWTFHEGKRPQGEPQDVANHRGVGELGSPLRDYFKCEMP